MSLIFSFLLGGLLVAIAWGYSYSAAKPAKMRLILILLERLQGSGERFFSGREIYDSCGGVFRAWIDHEVFYSFLLELEGEGCIEGENIDHSGTRASADDELLAQREPLDERAFRVNQRGRWRIDQTPSSDRHPVGGFEDG